MFNLPESAQEVFDTVAKHLLTQNKVSTNGNGNCRYRHNGLRCAAGCLIPDEAYDRAMEGKLWETLVDTELVPSEHSVLIGDLQTVHDESPVDLWALDLQEVASKHSLVFNEEKYRPCSA